MNCCGNISKKARDENILQNRPKLWIFCKLQEAILFLETKRVVAWC